MNNVDPLVSNFRLTYGFDELSRRLFLTPSVGFVAGNMECKTYRVEGSVVDSFGSIRSNAQFDC